MSFRCQKCGEARPNAANPAEYMPQQVVTKTRTLAKVGGQDVPRDALLAALHNHTRSVGLGVLQDIGRDLTRTEARSLLEQRNGSFNFDYLLGRPLKVQEYNGAIDDRSENLYERDAGRGAFRRAVEDALTMPDDPG